MNLPEQLKEVLMITMPLCAPASGGTHVVFRCPYCGDSHHPRSKHFYVNLGYNNTLPMFYCHLCNAAGVVTAEHLMFWGIYTVDINVNLTKYNTAMYRLPKNNITKDLEVYKLDNYYISDTEISRHKLNYINNRLGTSLEYSDLLKLKIILNLYDLMGANKDRITKLTRKEEVVEELNHSFIGFISQDNAFLNMRNLRKGRTIKPVDKRWVNYNIFGKLDNTQRLYTIPTSINLNSSKPTVIRFAEGSFDILSVYFNLESDRERTIYSAICGSGILNVLKHYLVRMKLMNLEIHYYRDNDMSMHIIDNIGQILEPYGYPFYVHSNMYKDEKDFGVPMDRISEQIERIL